MAEGLFICQIVKELIFGCSVNATLYRFNKVARCFNDILSESNFLEQTPYFCLSSLIWSISKKQIKTNEIIFLQLIFSYNFSLIFFFVYRKWWRPTLR